MVRSSHAPPDTPRQSSGGDDDCQSVRSCESADSVVQLKHCESDGERTGRPSRRAQATEEGRRHDSLVSSLVHSLCLTEERPECVPLAMSPSAVPVLVKACLEEVLPALLDAIRKEHRDFLESTLGEYRSMAVGRPAEAPPGDPPVMTVLSRSSRHTQFSLPSHSEADALSDPSDLLVDKDAHNETKFDGTPALTKATGVGETGGNHERDKTRARRRNLRLPSCGARGVKGLELDVADAVLCERHLSVPSRDQERGESDASASGFLSEAIRPWRRVISGAGMSKASSHTSVVPEPTPPDHKGADEQQVCPPDVSPGRVTPQDTTPRTTESYDYRMMRKKFGSMSSSDLRLVRAEELTQSVAVTVSTSQDLIPMTVSARSDQPTLPGAKELPAMSDATMASEMHDADAITSYCPPTGVIIVLRLCGVGPRTRLAMFCSVLFWIAMLAALGMQVYDTATHREDAIHIADSHCSKCVWFRGTLGHCVVAITAVLSLAAARHSWRRAGGASASPVRAAFDLLTAYAHSHDFTDQWDEAWRRDARHALMLWFSTSIVCVVSFCYDTSVSGRQWDNLFMFQVVSVVFVHGLLHVVNLCVLRVCRAQGLTVDVFCEEVVSDKDLEAATMAWNVLQAVLLKASACIMAPFVTLVLSVAAAAPASLADLYAIFDEGATVGIVVSILPNLIMWYVIIRTSLIASRVSESCSRVPALINCHFFGVGTEQARQLAVDFVANSGAGFYVSDVRLTSALIFKFLYMWSVVALGLVARMVGNEAV